MDIDTDPSTLSLPTTTAPTDLAESTSLPLRDGDCECTAWDTSIVPNIGFPIRGWAQCPGTHSDHASSPGSHEESARAGRSVEESCKRALQHFPTPGICFPMPTLEFDFRVAVALKSEPTHLEGRSKREITAVSSGSWSGSFGHGKVLAGGYDLGQARGFRPIRILEGVFVMQTMEDQPAVLEMRTRGSLSGPCDVLDSLLSPQQPKQIDSRRYGFRMFSSIKTADKRYAEIVNCGLWVASGVWHGDQLIIDLSVMAAGDRQQSEEDTGKPE